MSQNKEQLSDADRFQIIAKDFIEKKDVIYFKDSFYLFKDGIWRLESDENTKAWIYSTFQKKFNKSIKRNSIDEIALVIRHLTYENELYRDKIVKADQYNDRNTVNVKSGILNLDTLETKPYTKEDLCFHKLNFDYKPKPECPIMMKFLSTSMGYDWPVKEETKEYKEEIGCIQEFMGYTLMPGNKHEKALIMTGRGRNGKGTLIHIWSKILGDYNLSSLSLEALNDPQSVGATKNKLVNFSYDADSKSQLDSGVVKSAVAGEPVNSNEKWKAPQSFVFTAKIIIACNDLPFTKSTDPNIKERFIVIPFNREFTEEERDPDLKKKLETEVADVFSWAMEGLIRLRKRGRFLLPAKFVSSMEQYMFDNDNVEQWLQEKNIKDPKRRAKRSELWIDYRDYCKDSMTSPYKKSNFFLKLEKKGYKKTLINGEYYFNGLLIKGIIDDTGASNTYIQASNDLPF